MKLHEILIKKKAAILQGWRSRILDTYPADAARFLTQERDRFRNPVGRAVLQDTDVLLNRLLEREPCASQQSFPEDLLKIRAVQEYSADEAVGFVFALKSAIWEQLQGESSVQLAEYVDLEARIDNLVLQAFGCYMKCREAIHDIRVSEIKRGFSAAHADRGAIRAAGGSQE